MTIQKVVAGEPLKCNSDITCCFQSFYSILVGGVSTHCQDGQSLSLGPMIEIYYSFYELFHQLHLHPETNYSCPARCGFPITFRFFRDLSSAGRFRICFQLLRGFSISSNVLFVLPWRF